MPTSSVVNNDVNLSDGFWLGNKFYPIIQSHQRMRKQVQKLSSPAGDGLKLGDRFYPMEFDQGKQMLAAISKKGLYESTELTTMESQKLEDDGNCQKDDIEENKKKAVTKVK